MSNFIDDVLNADALIEEIDDYIEKWHNSDSDLSVYEYLGMTEEEYYLWVKDDFYLKYIIAAHDKNVSIKELLKNEYSSRMVARAESPEKAKIIYNWLKSRGVVE